MLGFKNINHFIKMNEFKKRMPAHAQSDLNFLAILYLITGNDKLNDAVQPYLAIDQARLQIDSMLAAEIESPSIRIFVKLIAELYTEKPHVPFMEMLQHLSTEDAHLVHLMFEAHQKRFATIDIQEFQYQSTPDPGSIIH